MQNFFAKHRKLKIFFLVLFLVFIVFWFWGSKVSSDLVKIYENRESQILHDRNGKIIQILPNEKEFYTIYSDTIPDGFKKLLLQKEDRYFYYHLGVNPVSTLSAAWSKAWNTTPRASSTINQQLVKILLDHENERTVRNKIQEILYAIALELHTDKEDILEMYVNSIYLGNQAQGIDTASQLYFESNPENLTQEQILKLLATISSPSETNPFRSANTETTKKLAEKLGVEIETTEALTDDEIQNKKNDFREYLKSNSAFELQNSQLATRNSQLNIDSQLTNKIRSLVSEELSLLKHKNAQHAAVVVLKLPENELLAIVGSPDPDSDQEGDQINMALEPRPIGSTVKPFIYTKGFEKNLRPYTLVEDKEYKFSTADGFAFYPKNYDYDYRGIVNLHYSLSNSLNVPTVKVLEYVGLEDFYSFLLDDLEFEPIQDLNNYQLGIALGELEMNLVRLTHYFSIFGNEGHLKPLKITDSEYYSNIDKQIFDPALVELTNQILIDRQTGIDQFGLVSNLKLDNNKIAVKTGTSREYHDSWTIGYTPDFVVGVWVGNAQNLPMDSVSGSQGAGRIWNKVVRLMLNSEYNHDSQFETELIREFQDEGNIENGLPNDDFKKFKNILLEQENTLITSPHDGDIFLLEENVSIPLISNEEVQWYLGEEYLDEGSEIIFEPIETGEFKIRAVSENREEKIEIVIELGTDD